MALGTFNFLYNGYRGENGCVMALTTHLPPPNSAKVKVKVKLYIHSL
jgi:hypothetical protein